MRDEGCGIRFTPLAYEDLDEIDTYISETLLNPQAAESLLEEMEQSIRRLGHFPYTGSPVADVSLADRGYRKLVVKNYLIFYLVDTKQKQIVIMRILYGAREYHNFL